MNLFRCLLLCCAGVVLATAAVRGDTPVYGDPSAPVEARVQDLLRRMTLDEKIGQMTQLNFSTYSSDGTENKVDVDPEKLARLIREYHVGSLLNGRAVPPKQWYQVLKTVQEIAIRESRLGIPIIYGIDHVHGTSYILGGTVFPHNLNIACTFDDAFAAQEGHTTMLEAEDLGQSWNFSPVLDVGVNPSWSRLYETFGEEPLVAARMGSLYVKALQADGRMAATAWARCARSCGRACPDSRAAPQLPTS